MQSFRSCVGCGQFTACVKKKRRIADSAQFFNPRQVQYSLFKHLCWDVGNLLLLLKKRRIEDSAHFFNAREVQYLSTCVGMWENYCCCSKNDVLQILPSFLMRVKCNVSALVLDAGNVLGVLKKATYCRFCPEF